MLGTAGALAQETGLWHSVGDWQVRVDSSLGHGCFMAASYKNGDVVRLGFNNSDDTSYLVLGNVKWRSLEEGKYYPVALQFDAGPAIPWTGMVTDGDFLSFQFSNMNVWQAFARSSVLTVLYQGSIVTQLPLTGTYAAVQVVRQCNREFSPLVGLVPRRDPFGH
jgi:hypothetical protein